MSKTNDLSTTINEMITCGEGILGALKDITVYGERMIKAAKQLKEILTADGLPAVKATELTKALPEKIETKTYSKEDVRGILAGKSAKGYGKEVKALLLKYGADKLSALSEEHYAAVIAEAEVIGNE